MEKVRHAPASPVVKKGKKKQAKVELDRLKQAEKKKRRLEKALATSAAIRSELEKKKQKKMEEQQKLDEEALATSAAIHSELEKKKQKKMEEQQKLDEEAAATADRLKQAEKKKRRLEKALATSAAIRSELEKKKQKKMEEQQKLDEEVAAIAEAVALHVLIGEDKDDSNNFIFGNNSEYKSWNDSSNINLFMGYEPLARYSVDGLSWTSDAYGHEWKNWENKEPLPPHICLKGLQAPYYTETTQGADISAGLIAAQAVEALKIAEDPAGARISWPGCCHCCHKSNVEGK